MEPANNTILMIGDWRVNPASGEISRNGETIRLELRTMRLLMCLAERAGQVVSIDDLLNQVWPEVTVSQDSVYQAVTSLRRQLGDDPKQPAYIATVPRLGYRMVARVRPFTETNLYEQKAPSGDTRHIGRAAQQTQIRLRWLVAPAILLLAVLAVALLIRSKDVGKQP